VDKLIFLLNGYYDPSFRSLESEPGTPLSEDSDFAYLKAVSDSRPVSAGGPVHSTVKSSCAEDTGAPDYAPLYSPGHPSSEDEKDVSTTAVTPTPTILFIRDSEWHVTTAGAHSARSIASISDSSRSSCSGDARCPVTVVGIYVRERALMMHAIPVCRMMLLVISTSFLFCTQDVFLEGFHRIHSRQTGTLP
jgi:hypothetical protein